mmetsp:Transcript_32815/g.57224  ORF Transcript_32815/g.57224 Transcript_32815/m.57224 type:complete len:249 (+) Transcript_32815:11361-12107(+)
MYPKLFFILSVLSAFASDPPASEKTHPEGCSIKQPVRVTKSHYPFDTPNLPFFFDFLEPFTSVKTLVQHSRRHHSEFAYQLNSLMENRPDLQQKSLVELIQDADPEIQRQAGGLYNHNLYWASLTTKECSGKPSGLFEQEFYHRWLSSEVFEADFEKSASSLFGSGWAWLCVQEGSLTIKTTADESNPLSLSPPCLPLLAVDLWEHAYYLSYKQDRSAYLKTTLKQLDWSTVSFLYEQFVSRGQAVDF